MLFVVVFDDFEVCWYEFEDFVCFVFDYVLFVIVVGVVLFGVIDGDDFDFVG